MLFNSIQFGIFLTIVFFLYWFIPNKYRVFVLLIANIYFYLSFNIKYLLVLFFNIVISYLCALLLDKYRNKVLLACSIILCTSSLLICKYLNFSFSILDDIGIKLNQSTLQILVPIGISFYTFEIISYLVDVYKNKTNCERNFIYYAVYISFFPTISSGPIERATSLIAQFKEEKTFKYEDGINSLKIIAWGLFKKIVIADNLAVYVNYVYDNLHSYSGFVLVIVAIFYTIEIYCDFSGYSDMALGVAKLLGFNITNNFRSPYFVTTIKEFWVKWHISLTNFLRDYIYIPLGGNRKGKIRKWVNILIVFLISGLWHGANYTFIVWGLIHAVCQIFEDVLHIKSSINHGILYWLRVIWIFIIVTIAWIFFRADSLNDAIYVINNSFVGINNLHNYIVSGLYSFDKTPLYIILHLVIYLVPLFIIDWINTDGSVIKIVNNKNVIIRYALYVLLIAAILLFHCLGQVNFIYFKF